jgi:predicted RNA polymerase sigma factor
MAFGPDAALPLVDAFAAEPSLDGHHLLHAVRADLLVKLGRPSEAGEAFVLAAELTHNQRERALLRERAQSTLS